MESTVNSSINRGIIKRIGRRPKRTSEGTLGPYAQQVLTCILNLNNDNNSTENFIISDLANIKNRQSSTFN